MIGLGIVPSPSRSCRHKDRVDHFYESGGDFMQWAKSFKKTGSVRPLWIVIWVWIVLVSSCFAALIYYRQHVPPNPNNVLRLSVAKQDVDSEGRFHLMMAIHPMCPCSNASATELQRLLAHSTEKIRCTILAYTTAQTGTKWLQSQLIARFQSTPSTTVVSDVDGRIASQYRMAYSGATVLIRPDGTMAYWGGITPSRGHEGDNFGVDSILYAIEHDTKGIIEGPVYGCSIDQDLPAGVE